MEKSVLIIGAGASKGAREAFSVPPPLGKGLFSWLKSSFGNIEQKLHLVPDDSQLLKDVNEILSSYNPKNIPNFEEFISELYSTNSSGVQSIHRALVFYMSCFNNLNATHKKLKPDLDFGFNNFPDGYDKFIKKIGADIYNFDVISLNYDVLFEAALERNSIDYNYPKMSESADGVKIFKPHGSINFFCKPQVLVGAGYNGHTDQELIHPIKLHQDGSSINPFVKLLNFNPCLTNRNINLKTWIPIIARYEKAKKTSHNQNVLDEIRAEFDSINRKLGSAIFWGVNVENIKTDDLFLNALFSKSYVKRYVIDLATSKAKELHAEIQNLKFFNGLEQFLDKY